MVLAFDHPTLFSIFYWGIFLTWNGKGLIMVWLVALLAIWETKNWSIFSNDPSETSFAIKLYSSKFLLDKTKSSHCLFYEWNVDTLERIFRK